MWPDGVVLTPISGKQRTGYNWLDFVATGCQPRSVSDHYLAISPASLFTSSTA